jgi:hypothetical protein
MFQMGKGNSGVKLACLFPLSPFLPPLLRLALVSFSLSSFSVFWMNETKWNKMK